MKLFNIFKMNITPIVFLALKISGVIFSVLTIVLSFLTFEDMHIESVFVRVSILVSIPLLSFVLSTLLTLFVFKESRIWKKGKNSVVACYGDLMKYSFGRRYKDRRIVVIPVNDTFDTIVEEPNENISHPLVSPNTIHGMWLKKYCAHFNISPKELSDRIQKSLKLHGFCGTEVEREKGNKLKYSLGDVAIIDGPNNSTFFLLAISTFNEDNNAHVGKKELRQCIEDLLDFYDKNGQSTPLYIPLVGTGSSRAGLTHEQSLKLIKSCVLTSEDKINGSVNIVVYSGDKNKVSIFK